MTEPAIHEIKRRIVHDLLTLMLPAESKDDAAVEALLKMTAEATLGALLAVHRLHGYRALDSTIKAVTEAARAFSDDLVSERAERVETKVCAKCGDVLPLSAFRISRRRRGKEGVLEDYHHSYCRACDRVVMREVRARKLKKKQAQGSG